MYLPKSTSFVPAGTDLAVKLLTTGKKDDFPRERERLSIFFRLIGSKGELE
jgi:hypothetical protein